MIDRQDVEHVAELARLKLSESEIAAFTDQLGSILAYADQLKQVDTGRVEPTCFVSAGHDPLRDDAVAPSLPKEQLLRNGPSVKSGYFAVPKVITQ